MMAPDLEIRIASALSRSPWGTKRETVLAVAPLLGHDPNHLLDLVDDHIEAWRLAGGAL